MRYAVRPVFAICAVCLVSTLPFVSLGAAPDTHNGIAWQVASSEADVDRAFVLARRTGRPVFLYWGAVWCPPCNQVKATLFSRPEFVERTKSFVPVYVDGDKPGAQKVAARFHVSGYPTMVLFKPDGSELTRLPGEVDPERYLLALAAGVNSQLPVKELASQALVHRALTQDQWQLLSFYSWDTDDQQVFRSVELASRLSELAAAVPANLGPIKDRIALKALAARSKQDGNPGASERESDLALLDRVLNSPDSSRAQWDILIAGPTHVVKYVATSPDARVMLARKWDAALERLLASNALSRSDSVDALEARVELWKLVDGSGELSAPRQQAVRGDLMRIVSSTTNRYERQAVIPSAADVLAAAGLIKESDDLLKSELPRAVAPYYHMLVLAANAKKRGDKREALSWYEQAWRRSEGPATRVQWGSSYVRQLVELAPQDTGRVQAAAAAVIAGLEPRGETFFERNERSLQRMAVQLLKWQGADQARVRVVAKLKSQLSKTCKQVPAADAGRENCRKVFEPSATKNES